jgi:hypothetical protein
MNDEEMKWFLFRNRGQIVRVLAADDFLRQEFMAKLSCAEVQRGPHIDTLARDPQRNLPQNLPVRR